MDLGITNLKDLIEVLVGLIGAGALAFAAYTYHVSRKQLNFAVIVSCTERFQKIMPDLKSGNTDAVKQYIDLCHEELFYFKHKYLPDEIVLEWLDGMVFYLPHFHGESELNTEESFLVTLNHPLLDDYPRIKYTFAAPKEYKITDPDERKELVRELNKRLLEYTNSN